MNFEKYNRGGVNRASHHPWPSIEPGMNAEVTRIFMLIGRSIL